MPSKLETFGKPANHFEQQTWQTLKNTLDYAEGNYIILGDVRIGYRQIDCLVIAPQCVFTIECKGVEGKVVKNYNGGVKIYDFSSGKEILDDRYENPFKQADNQWKTTRKFISEAGANIFVQALVVFPDKCIFDLPTKTNHGPVFTTLANLPWIIQNTQPKLNTKLTRKQQDSIYYLIKYGPEKIYEGVKRNLATIHPEKLSNTYTPKQVKTQPAKETTRKSPPIQQQTQIETRPAKQVEIRLLQKTASESHTTQNQQPNNKSLFQKTRSPLSNLLFNVISSPRTYMLLLLASPILVYCFSTYMFSSQENKIQQETQNALPTIALTVVPIKDSVQPIPTTSNSINIEDKVENQEEVHFEYNQSNSTNYLKVIEGSNLRNGPGIENGVVTIVDKGTIVTIIDQTADASWFFIKLPNSETTGWIGSTRVQPADEE